MTRTRKTKHGHSANRTESAASSAPLTTTQLAAAQAAVERSVPNASGRQRLTLEQRLALFDPALHRKEVMATVPLGNEQLA